MCSITAPRIRLAVNLRMVNFISCTRYKTS